MHDEEQGCSFDDGVGGDVGAITASEIVDRFVQVFSAVTR
jgi:hypothetical protein